MFIRRIKIEINDSGMITKKMIKVLKQYVDFCEYQRGVTDEVLYNNIIKLANTDKEMTADKALSKEELAEKYMYAHNYCDKSCSVKKEFISDLNALLRATLIDFAEHEELSSTKYSTYEEWINNYLK
jgi:hypothetical protein